MDVDVDVDVGVGVVKGRGKVGVWVDKLKCGFFKLYLFLTFIINFVIETWNEQLTVKTTNSQNYSCSYHGRNESLSDNFLITPHLTHPY